MHDIFGVKLNVGDRVVYSYPGKPYMCHKISKVNEASVVVSYTTPKTKKSRVRRLSTNTTMIVKINEQQLNDLKETEMFKTLGGK